jgi:hypothetical protein
MVMVLPDQFAVTPAGNPDGLPIPVAMVVAWVMFVSGSLIQAVGVDDAAETVLKFTVMVPVALTTPQLPMIGMAIKGIE